MNKYFIITCLSLIFGGFSLNANVISWDEATQTYVVDQYGSHKFSNSKKKDLDFLKLKKQNKQKKTNPKTKLEK